uniref:helix-turn-helix domain-containing protein n=1 Tax=Sphingomonas bacterium TaxID=1895847 RepID=UPI0015755F83
AEQQPGLAERFVALHGAWRAAEARRQIADEAIASGVEGGGRLPWEEVRDWFHEAGNYVGVLDEAAEALAGAIGGPPVATEALVAALADGGVTVTSSGDGGPLRRFDPASGSLILDAGQPAATRRFLLAHQLVSLRFAEAIANVSAGAALVSDEARRLLGIGLANYAAGALMMPYADYAATARDLRHDIDRLRQRFGVSFEQACHRLSTLQRPGARGLPFFFCRVDMAGNITKRHSATRLQFARFGGACPLWIVHEAVAIPDRILVQLAETPDGVRYVSMAKGLVKPSGSYQRSPRRYAVALGCEAIHARAFVYADGLDLGGAATPIGISCRLCPRDDCDQRAFPPAERPIMIDPDVREVVPYRVL